LKLQAEKEREAARERLIERFLELAQIDGLSGEEQNVLAYVLKILKKLGLRYQKQMVAKLANSETGNLLLQVGNGGNAVFLAHMDTARSTKNLKAVRHSDRISSAGDTILGADNRAGMAILLMALELILEKGLKPNFSIAFTVCEESSLAGSRALQLPPQISLGFIFDSAHRPGKFITQAYGACDFSVTISGKAAHSGISPEKGVNAIAVGVKAMSQIRMGRINPDTTLNIGKIKGGTAVNVVPDELVLEGEIRSAKAAMVEKILRDIRLTFEKSCQEAGAGLDFRSGWAFKPYHIDLKSEVYQKVAKAIESAGLNAEPVSSAGGSDANSLNEKGIPAINLGIGAQNPHANDEFILIEDLEAGLHIALNLMENLE
jgi:tripeptide aminopeptidase